MKKLILKKNNGITLIVLVITIIVLLILTGISIQMLTGENGILIKSGEAKEKTELLEIEQKLNAEILSIQAKDSRSFNLELLNQNLKNSGEYDLALSDNRLVATHKRGKYIFEIDNNGNMEYKGVNDVPTNNHYMIIKNANYGFWQEQYRTKITKVITKYTMYKPDNILEQWDLSASSEPSESVMAYLADDGNEGYILYICANGRLKIEPTHYATGTEYRFNDYFNGFTALKECDLTAFNTEDATTMSNMFSGCANLTTLNVKSFNTKNVRSMYGMFTGCLSLVTLDLSSFDTSSLKEARGMFTSGYYRDIMSLKTIIGIENFNTQNVERMDGMFKCCGNLERLDLSKWKTDNVENMSELFYNCSSLSGTIDLTGWNIKKVTNISSMFLGCGWNEIIMPGEAPLVNNISSMFNGCKTKKIDISGIEGSRITDVYGLFFTEAEIEEINISNFDSSNITSSDLFVRGASFSPDVIIHVKNNDAKQFFQSKRSSLTDDNFVVVNK